MFSAPAQEAQIPGKGPTNPPTWALTLLFPCSPRLALQHGDGHVVDYLCQPVIDYILKSQLYINASG